MTPSAMLTDTLDGVAGLIQESLLMPLLYHLGLMAWEDLAYSYTIFVVYGVLQVLVVAAICSMLERWRPVEIWPDRRAVGTDILYTLIARAGILPLFTFVLFYEVQVRLTGWLADHGYVTPMMETIFPALLGHAALTFLIYAVILDFAEYWRHRISHRIGVLYALHSVHHAQRQMTFWSDDRNHVLDDLIAAIWFGIIALLIGVPPMQFPLLVLTLRAIESLSHANTRLSFGWLGERLLISPRFHRAHHGVLAAGQSSCNYGAVLPWWDMLFGTADFSRAYVRTGDPGAEEAMHSGSWLQQQAAGLRRVWKMARRARARS